MQTSHGKVDTTVVQSIDFSNWQKYNVSIDGSVYDQTDVQTTNIASSTAIKQNGQTANSFPVSSRTHRSRRDRGVEEPYTARDLTL